MKYRTYKQYPFGRIGIEEENDKITRLHWAEESFPGEATEKRTPVLTEAIKQLDEYFAGKRRKFDLPLAPAGTEFMQRAWRELRRIPYGKTTTYGQIAARLGNPKAARAVGLANNRNPIAIVVPCHRVIGADGKLVGYAGGLDIKRQLLELEAKKSVRCNRTS